MPIESIDRICRRLTVLLGIAALATLGSGCAQITPYPNTLAKNVHVHTRTDSGSMFSSVQANLHVYAIDQHCKTRYLGVMALDAPTVDVGLAPDRRAYLVFGFNSSSWLANGDSSISQDTLLTPRSGYSYDIDVSYVDDLYNVVIHEVDRRGRRHEMDTRRLSACQEQ